MTTPAPASPLTKVEIQPPIARLTLSCPPLNVIDLAMTDELSHALTELEARADISVLIIAGEGKSFSAGVAAQAHTRDNVATLLSKFHGVIRALVNSRKVSIAAVRGHCLGGGAELAMVCDLAFTTETAQWGFPEIKLGCYPPVACTALAALIGQKRAADLILTGRTITGREAAEIGLANRAVAENNLDVVVNDSIQHLRDLSPACLAVAKKASYVWNSMHFDKGLERAEKVYLEELMKTEDVEEGISAFLEKRKPQWKGR